MKLIIVSGRSGSGKSIALHVLEDLGYNCIDGVPFELLTQLINTVDAENNKVAISLDIRNLPDQAAQIEQLRSVDNLDIIGDPEGVPLSLFE